MRVASQQHWANIYPFHAGNAFQGLMGDGSVQVMNTNISVRAWSALVTPNGSEAEEQGF